MFAARVPRSPSRKERKMNTRKPLLMLAGCLLIGFGNGCAREDGARTVLGPDAWARSVPVAMVTGDEYPAPLTLGAG